MRQVIKHRDIRLLYDQENRPRDSIGVGWEGHCGNITIKKTVTSVTAKDGVGLSPTGEGYLGIVTIEEGANVIQN